MLEKILRATYKPLWKLMIVRDIKRVGLCEAAGLSASTTAKIGRDENATAGVLVRIRQALNGQISDTVELVESEGI